ncbi:hypothetical protein D6D13_03724 [Aureobasidium pullulans]|uniref:Uncharacterized protein n=1 Tax=Aureobasidium pullulans TaxID=5580 RepID=A0A4S9D081_AURPU|nr:hypothetical protein D6D13_03724 [Aureobasidium pullulans]
MQAVNETLSNAKLRPTKMIQPNCSNLLQTLTLGCMLGLTGYFGGISADHKVYRAPIEPTLCRFAHNCDGKISSERSICFEAI